MKKNNRVIVFAYSEVGYIGLSALLDKNANIVAVYTHRDNPNENIWFQSVAELALQYNLPVIYDATFSSPEELKRLQQFAPDIIFSFYYRDMIPETILSLAKDGAFNLHGSLLPKYRGRAPVNWAVLNGETETGATLHYMLAKPDAGAIVDQEKVLIEPDETAEDVSKKVNLAAASILERQIDNILAGTITSYPQDNSKASYYGRRKPDDGKIMWEHSAQEIHNLVRAVTHPFPGAFTFLNQHKLFIWKTRLHKDLQNTAISGTVISLHPLLVTTSHGVLEIVEMTPEVNIIVGARLGE
jgi:methionyl-tRNA formyltransferase